MTAEVHRSVISGVKTMTDEDALEWRRIDHLRGMHARSEYAGRPLIVAGHVPHRVLYIANRVVIEYSDDGGATWVTWPGTENGLETDEAQKAVVQDYDFPFLFSRCYRTYGLGELAATSPALLHTEPTQYRVDELHYAILDVPSPRRLSEVLPTQSVALPTFSCEISGRAVVARPEVEFDDVRAARSAVRGGSSSVAIRGRDPGRIRFRFAIPAFSVHRRSRRRPVADRSRHPARIRSGCTAAHRQLSESRRRRERPRRPAKSCVRCGFVSVVVCLEENRLRPLHIGSVRFSKPISAEVRRPRRHSTSHEMCGMRSGP